MQTDPLGDEGVGFFAGRSDLPAQGVRRPLRTPDVCTRLGAVFFKTWYMSYLVNIRHYRLVLVNLGGVSG